LLANITGDVSNQQSWDSGLTSAGDFFRVSSHNLALVRVFVVRTVAVKNPDIENPDIENTVAVSTQAAFEIFYRREFSSLAVIAGTVAANRSVGEHSAQKALAKANQQWSTVAVLDKPGAWVRRVAINLAIGRKQRSLTEAKALLKIGPTATTAAETRRGDPAVWAAVDQLAPKQRAVVALHYLEDRPVAEIAEILDISVSAATSILHKARANLATGLGESHG